uniref:CxC3 like cysteine cluster domain-containing protein n=2 Tax=Clytia hemisphaerica TaxID=252671 RepID=A0A7M5XED2_9CNID
MLLFKDCVSCGHLCDNCEIRTMNAQIAVITTRGRFDLNKYTRICCCCGEHTNPFQIRTLIQNGFWPTTLNYAQTIVNEECFKLWDRFSKRMPGSSLQSFLRSLSDISISNGRNGTINANTFVQVYREYNFAQYEIEKRLSFSWFDCPACGDQQHSCHVDGNCKLYRYKTSGKLVSNSYYGDIFIAKNQHVDDLLEELNYNPKRNSEPVHCGGSILKAAQNVSRKKASLDETGFEYCVCRHGVAQRGVNMYRGEIFGYAYYLQKGIMVDNNVKFMWYDVICKYWAWLESHDPFIKEDMNPALSVLHGKMHQMLCQVKYGGRWQTGAALTSGEEAEQVNSYLSRLTNTTKYMLPQNRDDTITEFAMDWNGRKIRNLAMTLVQRYKKVQKELGKISKPTNFDELEQKKQDFILTTQEYAKKGEGDEKEKLMEEIAKIRFEVAMRSAMIGKFAASSKQRTKLRRKNTNDNEKADKLEVKLKEIFGDSDSWKQHLEETERKLEIRKKSKQTIDDGMLYQRHLEEKKLLVEEMKNFTSHYKKKLMSLKTGKSCALASNYTSDIHDKPTLEMQHDTLMEEGEQNLRRKAIDLCSQQLSIGIELFSKVVTNDFSEIPDEENESEFPKSDHETSDTSSDEIDEHNES